MIPMKQSAIVDARLSRDNQDGILRHTAGLAARFLADLDARPVAQPVDVQALVERLGGPLPASGCDARTVIDALVSASAPGLVASAGPRYFGFVTGGSVPAALAADWLTSAWDQNASLHVMSPAAAAAEIVAGAWLVELFGLPSGASVGFTTGATMANFTALAAARHAVLRRVGWDVETDGLVGAPAVTVVVGEDVHVSVLAAVQMLGLGRGRVRRVPVDGEGRMLVDRLATALTESPGPTIVCAQAGNVASGACDPFAEIAAVAERHGAWLHVDGAFGLWAATVPSLRTLVAGVERADSWATDAHKWLNVPYDSGLVMVRDREAHRAAMTLEAPYLTAAATVERDGSNWVPELSRRARGFTVYAALRALGRDGVAALVQRCCRLARRMAELLAEAPGVTVLNDVVLNQVLVAFTPAGGGDRDRFTREVIRRVQADGTCWAGGTVWRGRAAMRISISNWSTTTRDIERAAAAIRGACT